MPFEFKVVDAVDYFEIKSKKVVADIMRVKQIEHKSSGTAFIMFDSVDNCNEAIEML